jgi:hypothetical protein
MARLILFCQSPNSNLYVNAAALYCSRFTISSITLVGITMNQRDFAGVESAFTRFRAGSEQYAPSGVYAELRACTDVRFKLYHGDRVVTELVAEFGGDAYYDLSGLTKQQLLRCAVELVALRCNYIYTTRTAHPRQDLLHEMPDDEMGIDDLSDISRTYYKFLLHREGRSIFLVSVASLIFSLIFFLTSIFLEHREFFVTITDSLELFAALVAGAIAVVIGLEAYRQWRSP